jgi:hypothetical protein
MIAVKMVLPEVIKKYSSDLKNEHRAARKE